MRKILYVAILASLLFAPVNRVDVGKLLPIRAVAVYVSNDQIVLETDAGNKGQGKTLDESIDRLKQNASAIIYLDTVELLLVSHGAKKWLPELERCFKPSVKVCFCEAQGDVEEAAKYADVHGEITKMRPWRTK